MVGAATAWHRLLGGVVEQGMVTLRSPRNLGGLPSSFAKSAARASLKQKVQASGSRVRGRLDPNRHEREGTLPAKVVEGAGEIGVFS